MYGLRPWGHGHIIRALADPNRGAEGKAAYKAWIGDTREVGREGMHPGRGKGKGVSEERESGRLPPPACLGIPPLSSPSCRVVFFGSDGDFLNPLHPPPFAEDPNSGFKFTRGQRIRQTLNLIAIYPCRHTPLCPGNPFLNTGYTSSRKKLDRRFADLAMHAAVVVTTF